MEAPKSLRAVKKSRSGTGKDGGGCTETGVEESVLMTNRGEDNG